MLLRVPKEGIQLMNHLIISVLWSLLKFEGPQGLVRCTTESDCCLLNVCNIREPINIINNNIKTMFSNISLREITQ